MKSSTYDVTYVITNTYNINGKLLNTIENRRVTTLKDIVAQLGIKDGYSTHPWYKKLVRITATGADLKQAIYTIFGGSL